MVTLSDLCSDDILQTTMGVRETILVLLDSWQEAFGGAGGKYPQFYWSYEELRVSFFIFVWFDGEYGDSCFAGKLHH